jgi:hypothetical protein
MIKLRMNKTIRVLHLASVGMLLLMSKSQGTAATPTELRAIADFTISKEAPYVPAYKDGKQQALAIDASRYKDKFAAAEAVFPGPSGTYDIVLTTLAETDGESTYQLLVNGTRVGEFQNPPTEEDYKPVHHRWKQVPLKQGDVVKVAFSTHSNGRTPEGAGFAYARGRWRALAFLSPGATFSPPEPQEVLTARDTRSYFTFDFDPAAAPRVLEEQNGLLVVEAEDFARQSHDSIRRWYLTTTQKTPTGMRDPDENHAATASGNAYLEILPDTRKNHSEPLVQNENFTEDPGRMAVLYYPVYFNTPGRYYVWARACPTGSEDNGLHVGLDGQWPATAMKMQWIAKSNAWHWDSKQRTEQVHTGVKYRIYLDVKEPGYHTVLFSMREDGFEMDRWLMSTNRDILVHGDPGVGPAASPLRKRSP